MFVCVDALHTSQQLFSHVESIPFLIKLHNTKQWIKCPAQGHNPVTQVSLELATL